MYRKTIFNIVLSGLFCALAIILGAFAYFPLFGGVVYLIGLVVFIMPIFLSFPFAFLSGVISVILTDVISGWAQYTWISAIAYGGSIIMITLFLKLKIKAAYMIGILLAAGFNIAVYYFLTDLAFDHSYAIGTAAATAIQFAIIVPLCSIFFYPLQGIKRIFIK